MNPEALVALKGSIKKWELIVKGKEKDNGGTNCPLCILYAKSPGYCGECPISLKTKRVQCDDTPYEDWRKHHSQVHEKYPDKALSIDCPECKRLAKKELAFLKSLLPKRKVKK
jgi:hypothetical protein